jgi:hypothetical protein
MAWATGQVSGTNVSIPLCQVPGGPCTVLLSNLGTVTAYYGAGTVVTTSNGVPLATGAVHYLTGYQGGGTPLQMITANATATVGFVVSSAPGATGL